MFQCHNWEISINVCILYSYDLKTSCQSFKNIHLFCIEISFFFVVRFTVLLCWVFLHRRCHVFSSCFWPTLNSFSIFVCNHWHFLHPLFNISCVSIIRSHIDHVQVVSYYWKHTQDFPKYFLSFGSGISQHFL